MCCCLNKLSNEYNTFNYSNHFIEIFKKKIYPILKYHYSSQKSVNAVYNISREVILILTSVGLCVIFRYVFYLTDVSIQYVGLSLKLHILTNCLLNILLSEISILIQKRFSYKHQSEENLSLPHCITVRSKPIINLQYS